eukprot:1067194-Pyramimonas_sp.AAC.1
MSNNGLRSLGGFVVGHAKAQPYRIPPARRRATCVTVRRAGKMAGGLEHLDLADRSVAPRRLADLDTVPSHYSNKPRAKRETRPRGRSVETCRRECQCLVVPWNSIPLEL